MATKKKSEPEQTETPPERAPENDPWASVKPASSFDAYDKIKVLKGGWFKWQDLGYRTVQQG